MVNPSTIYDGVRAFTPHFIAAARAHRSAVGTSWRVDETSVKLGTRWHGLYRAIDEHGQIGDVHLSDRRTATAAQAFFEATMDASTVTPTRVTTHNATCYPPALRTVLPTVEHRPAN